MFCGGDGALERGVRAMFEMLEPDNGWLWGLVGSARMYGGMWCAFVGGCLVLAGISCSI